MNLYSVLFVITSVTFCDGSLIEGFLQGAHNVAGTVLGGISHSAGFNIGGHLGFNSQAHSNNRYPPYNGPQKPNKPQETIVVIVDDTDQTNQDQGRPGYEHGQGYTKPHQHNLQGNNYNSNQHDNGNYYHHGNQNPHYNANGDPYHHGNQNPNNFNNHGNGVDSENTKIPNWNPNNQNNIPNNQYGDNSNNQYGNPGNQYHNLNNQNEIPNNQYGGNTNNHQYDYPNNQHSNQNNQNNNQQENKPNSHPSYFNENTSNRPNYQGQNTQSTDNKPENPNYNSQKPENNDVQNSNDSGNKQDKDNNNKVEKTTKDPTGVDEYPLFVPLNDYIYGGDKVEVNAPKRETDKSKDKPADTEEVFPIDIRIQNE